jgi:hypothetical protein
LAFESGHYKNGLIIGLVDFITSQNDLQQVCLRLLAGWIKLFDQRFHIDFRVLKPKEEK